MRAPCCCFCGLSILEAKWIELAYASINELAAAEKISPTYVGRVLRLTLLAPEIVEAVLAGKQAAGLTVAELMEPCSVVWAEQRSMRTR